VGNLVIDVQGLGKEYRIGAMQERHDTLRDALTHGMRSMFRRNLSAGSTDSFWAVKDVSFQVHQGEVLGIIGRNGAGKSTLLKLLSRITAPTEGKIRLRGRVGTLLEVGTGFHPELSGRENIYLNGAILGMSRKDINAKFDEIIAFSEIEKFIDTPVKRYSSGMYIRLAFAVAAHLEPDILLVDEVLAVGDVAFQRKCLGKMEDVAGQGRTVIFISHNMSAIQQLCHRVIVLANGKTVADTTTEQGLRLYMSAFQNALDLEHLSEIERASDKLGQKARLSRVRFLNSQEQPADTLYYGETFSVEISCQVREALEGASFLIGIDSIFGERIVTMASKEKHHTFDAKAGDTVTGRVVLENLLLNPGTYRLSVALFTPGVGIDQLPTIASFSVTDMSSTHVFFQQINFGYMHHDQQEWDISATTDNQAQLATKAHG
jgi:lipopolysaccharide transport system ATP-binding protein